MLEAAAPLATGSAPTVSIGDWDGDGGLALLAGTAEGRFYLSRWTAAGGGRGGFGLPEALRAGDGADAAEILVQGGHRTDIQGPSESRWGYTPTRPAKLVDWNGDGLMDLVASDNSARSTVYVRRRA